MASAEIDKRKYSNFSHSVEDIRKIYSDELKCKSLIGAIIQFFDIRQCCFLRRSYAIRMNEEGKKIINEISPIEGEFYRIIYMYKHANTRDILFICRPMKERSYPYQIRWFFNVSKVGTENSNGMHLDDTFERCNIFTHWHNTIHHLLPDKGQQYINTIYLCIKHNTPNIDPVVIEAILEYISLQDILQPIPKFL